MHPMQWFRLKMRRLYIGELSRIGRARHIRAVFDTAAFVDEHMPLVPAYADRFALIRDALATVTVEGLYCEFGVFRGASLNYIAKLVDTHVVHGFDSFEGLPEDWRTGYPAGTFRTPLPKVRGNARLHPGWFDDILPGFLAEHSEPAAFLHMNAYLYSSTHAVLEMLDDRIVPGTVIVFDKFFNFPGWRRGEYRAFTEFVSASDVRFEYLGYCECQEQVAVRILSVRGGPAAPPMRPAQGAGLRFHV